MQFKNLRIARGLSQKMLAKMTQEDVGMISRYETGRCLPTPKKMAEITTALECDVKDIYTTEELDFNIKKSKKRAKKTSGKYHLSAYLPEEARELLPKIMEKLGYSGITEWCNQQYKLAKTTYENELRREEQCKKSI